MDDSTISSLMRKLRIAEKRLALIQFRANEALEEKRSHPDGHTMQREIACSNGLNDILEIIKSEDI